MADEKSRLGEIIGKCWKDAAFKQRFTSDPKSVFAEYGIDVPQGMNVKVVENTGDQMYITLPAPPPSGEELSKGDLAAVAGGASRLSARAVSQFRQVFTLPTSTQGKECVPW